MMAETDSIRGVVGCHPFRQHVSCLDQQEFSVIVIYADDGVLVFARYPSQKPNDKPLVVDRVSDICLAVQMLILDRAC